MRIEEGGQKPIFLQIQEGIEDAILSGAFKEEEQIPSTTEISTNYRINPATALKGINLLVAEDIIYKKRGIGMFVKEGAVEKIREKRHADFSENYIVPMVSEAKQLKISEDKIIELVKRGYENERD